ncbi:MAG TPA: protein-glutamate O-methyltransferase CheR, partial [Rhizobiales bacterium]|nr:protein-glutamate O-methyltransferase CheR [Hyphomicrobiales bacterium]
MTPQEFDYIRELLKERSGLVLGDEKRYLIESRLMPVARDEGMESLSDLVTKLKGVGSEALRSKVTEAMTINESFFFRDKTPFENFKDIIVPAMLASSRSASRSMRIWCAAASTGQEPYSLAIQIREMDDLLRGWNIEIVATDLSEEVLEKARSGLYSQFEVQRGLPIQLMVKYFKQTGSLWQIDSSIRSMVKYQHFNLLEDYTPLGTFDIIFCRNVLIYFDPPTKTDMLARMAQRMRPDGYLAVGAAETVIGISDDFKAVSGARGLYALQAGTGTAAISPAGSVAARPAA